MYGKSFRTAIGAVIMSAGLAIAVAPAQADSVAKGSAGSIAGSQTVFKGSGMILHGSADVVVASVTAVGKGIKVVLTTASGAVVGSLLIVGSLANAVVWQTGAVLVASAIYGGILLSTADDEVIVYVPGAKGKKLTHRSPYERDA